MNSDGLIKIICQLLKTISCHWSSKCSLEEVNRFEFSVRTLFWQANGHLNLISRIFTIQRQMKIRDVFLLKNEAASKILAHNFNFELSIWRKVDRQSTLYFLHFSGAGIKYSRIRIACACQNFFNELIYLKMKANYYHQWDVLKIRSGMWKFCELFEFEAFIF